MLLGSIEAGGTKFVCAVGDEDYRIKNSVRINTTSPKETLTLVTDYFKQFSLDALSIASFGPIDVQHISPTYGFITNTPKPGWKNVDFVGGIKRSLKVPVFFTTDVNGSAFGEYTMAQLFNEKLNSLVYLTVGTGVGGGAVIDGKILGSGGHPEMGHVYLKRHFDDVTFTGNCPFHKDCLEGLASGPAIQARTGIAGEKISPNDKVWNIIAYYLAQSALQQTLILRPDSITFGGGVINDVLLEKVRVAFEELNSGYIEIPKLKEYIRMPRVKNNGSATVGNFALAYSLLQA
ncbi:ROK family protein [Liquorilactobacillus satsumensis]|uniref:ROK family protein n=1 Tax=Liquorilactobacillus TaxID=2767888 RepID=UPI001E37BECF|nr:ROK family protein [Liquorilactobacillus satsumensis]MCC7667240.1 fructokinase/branched chain amino acid--2-keto-4-methylthiobutyrate aminotransferase [Liquorilactobacillus satsumensis]MCP9328075.1 ROK family protein [Liquorilactobacillus satsumensis]